MRGFLAAQAFVQIIGIAALHNEPGMGVQVILPRVGTAANAHTVSHTAILVFRTADRVEKGTSWCSKPLPAVSGYSYVQLNGERIWLIVNGSNSLAAIPPALPHLTTNCPSMQMLRPGYQPPDYESAAAVLSIPRGVMRACRAIAQGVQGRIDTRVTLNNNGNFRVVAGNRKVLTLKDDSMLMVVNAPTAWVEGSKGPTLKHVSHANAYFAMAVEQSAQCSLGAPGPVSDCIVAFAPVPGSPAVPHFPAIPLPFKTYECSNTQWP
ncbi:MAG TPA: hypothetical protein VEK57_22590 [Thermoanaerobaculia bacterium]|nr:hypothetical protein [Thermoanaerobaculia bacterium]